MLSWLRAKGETKTALDYKILVFVTSPKPTIRASLMNTSRSEVTNWSEGLFVLFMLELCTYVESTDNVMTEISILSESFWALFTASEWNNGSVFHNKMFIRFSVHHVEVLVSVFPSKEVSLGVVHTSLLYSLLNLCNHFFYLLFLVCITCTTPWKKSIQTFYCRQRLRHSAGMPCLCKHLYGLYETRVALTMILEVPSTI